MTAPHSPGPDHTLSTNPARENSDPVDNLDSVPVIDLSTHRPIEDAGQLPFPAADNGEADGLQPWQRPPFEQGNSLAVLHGARSPRIIEAVARIVQDDVIKQAPWIIEPIFADALERYCRAEARARLLSEYIFEVADDKGAAKVPRTLWDSAVNADNAASKAADALGITPIARARLQALTVGSEAAQASISTLAERGAAIRARREAAIEGSES